MSEGRFACGCHEIEAGVAVLLYGNVVELFAGGSCVGFLFHGSSIFTNTLGNSQCLKLQYR